MPGNVSPRLYRGNTTCCQYSETRGDGIHGTGAGVHAGREAVDRPAHAHGLDTSRRRAPGALTPTDPSKSARTSFGQVFLEERLKQQLRVINRGPDGRPWLDDRRISQAVGALTRTAAPSLLEANQKATELLLSGFTVDGMPGWDGGRDQRFHYIDWDNPLRNDLVVISQFRVDIPGTQGRKYIVPDEVLFVNGIPLALVECKKPGSALGEAVKQHLRYADRRGAQPQEGNAKLFHTMQLLIATSGDKAALGSITSGPQHYAPWRDPYPLAKEELAHRIKKREAAVSQQDILAGVVLHPVRLLDIVHNYVTFMQTDDGKTIKAVPRYQQYRAVSKAIDRLQTGQTKQQDGKKDRRGGVIWHTQGSGKSLTMSFLVRKMRTVPGLRKTKIVIVTDRTQLQGQLSKTMELAGEKADTTKKMVQARRRSCCRPSPASTALPPVRAPRRSAATSSTTSVSRTTSPRRSRHTPPKTSRAC